MPLAAGPVPGAVAKTLVGMRGWLLVVGDGRLVELVRSNEMHRGERHDPLPQFWRPDVWR